MKNVLIVLLLSISLIGCATTSSQIATADYGRYPANYEGIVQNWINSAFFDPYSIRDLRINPPKKYYLRPLFQRAYYGYRVRVSCNAKNRMGGYIGKEIRNLLIRNGMIIQTWKDGELEILCWQGGEV